MDDIDPTRVRKPCQVPPDTGAVQTHKWVISGGRVGSLAGSSGRPSSCSAKNASPFVVNEAPTKACRSAALVAASLRRMSAVSLDARKPASHSMNDGHAG